MKWKITIVVTVCIILIITSFSSAVSIQQRSKIESINDQIDDSSDKYEEIKNNIENPIRNIVTNQKEPIDYNDNGFWNANPMIKEKESRFVPGEILIKFNEIPRHKIKISEKGKIKTGFSSVDNILGQYPIFNAQPVFNIGKNPVADTSELERFYMITISTEQDIFLIINELNNDSNIEYAGPNHKVTTYLTPNDPYYHSSGSWGKNYSDLYGMHLIDAAGAWDVTTGSQDVVVAVIDTGVDYNHEDLLGNMWVNEDEILDENDTDGDGFIDNIYGADFANNDSDPMDGHGHGTHCAGTIGAVGNNSTGVVGVNWQTKIMAVKGLSDGGSGYSNDLANAIKWAADQGADVLSNSWGSSVPTPSNPVLEAAVRYAYNGGCVIVFAAGNDGLDVQYFSPQNMEETIAVAAIDDQDKKTWFTNFGELVDVCAPGEDILSLKAYGTDMYDDGVYIVDENYYRASGTSMACPHVAGLAALILSHVPYLSNEQIKEQIRLSADSIDDLNPGDEGLLGMGRINASKALEFFLDNVGISSLDVTPRHMLLPEVISINATVKNNGQNNETDVFVSFQVDGNEVDSITIPFFKRFTSQEIHFEWVPPEIGTYFLCVNITIPGGVDEYIEDNERSQMVIVGVQNKDTQECFNTIQEALDDPDTFDGHYIAVPEGLYQENLLVTKNVHIVGDNRENTVIYGAEDVSILIKDTNSVKISGFTITNGTFGISINTSLNTSINDVIISDNSDTGISLSSTSNTHISYCEIKNNSKGISVSNSSFGIITTDNNIVYNEEGIIIDSSSIDNLIYHNNFNNIINSEDDGINNLWDYGYFNESTGGLNAGNWWSDHDGEDLFRGPDQDETGSDGIIDEPCNVSGDSRSQDSYPLKEPWTGFLALMIFVDDDADMDWYDNIHVRTIEEGVNNASNGDIVFVYNGTYNEYIKINKSVSLVGEDRGNTIIAGALCNDPYIFTIITVMADEVSIEGFTLTLGNQSRGLQGGIYLSPGSNDVTISGNIIIECNWIGILVDVLSDNITISRNTITYNTAGAYIYDLASNVVFIENTITDNEEGVFVYQTYDTIFLNNTIANSNFVWGDCWGIFISNCLNTKIIGNTFANNDNTLLLKNAGAMIITDNTFISDSIIIENMWHNPYFWNSHIIKNNTANGKPIRYYVNCSNVDVPEDTGQIILAECNNITIQNLNLSEVDNGIQIGYSSFVTISGNTITNTGHSAILINEYSHNITIIRNSIINNRVGVYLQGGSYNNVIEENNLIDNYRGFGARGGVLLYRSYNNAINRNNITGNMFGISLGESNDNTVVGNNIKESRYVGISLSGNLNSEANGNIIIENIIEQNKNYGILGWWYTYNNLIYHNRFLYNQVNAKDSGDNHWDNGYPSGGNYWSDHPDFIDEFSGPNQNISIPDGIVDTPYDSIEGSNDNEDRYPLMIPYGQSVINLNTGEGFYAIQDAIYDNKTLDGHTIHVYPDVYYENLVINKSIALKGNGKDTTLIDGNKSGDVVRIISDGVILSGFTIQNSGLSYAGINVSYDNSTIYNNTLIDNNIGVKLVNQSSSNNHFYHNNFINNSIHAYDNCNSFWDNWYPSGGNYWSNYSVNDTMWGPFQNMTGNDGLGDIPYIIISGNNHDLYPLMEPWNGPLPSVPPPTIVFVDDDYNKTMVGWGYEYFDNIQNGIDIIAENGTIFVNEGIYYEQITIEKTITLIGEDLNNTIIDGESWRTVISISADRVNINGFTIQNSGNRAWPSYDAGIKIKSNYSTIERNMLINNRVGISIDGSYYTALSNVTIKDNSILQSDMYGIKIHFFKDGKVMGNIISFNNEDGIRLSNSYNNTLIDNTIESNLKKGIRIDNSHNNAFSNNIIRNNEADGIFIYDSYENIITYNIISNQKNGISILQSIQNEIFCNTVMDSGWYGISLDRSSNNRISSNNASNNYMAGIAVTESSSNIITGNNVKDGEYGIVLYYFADNNYIFHNNVINNIINGMDTCNNTWDDGYPAGGNYWSDYSGNDNFSGPDQNISGSDGIGDIPYNISEGNNTDRYPLINPFILSVNAGGPYSNIEEEDMQFLGSVTGLCHPYIWSWNFGDGNTSTLQNPTHAFTNQGNYTIFLTVTDIENNTANDTTWVLIEENNPPYQPNNPNPEDEETDVDLDSDLSWTGGDPDGDPVTYDVYFGTSSPPPLIENNQTQTSYDPGTFSYETTYYWQIIAWDEYDSNNASDIWHFTTEEEPYNPPTIEILKPENALYIRNKKILPLRSPFIIGYIDIEVEVSGDNVERIELYIDDELKAIFTDSSFSWTWEERVFFKHMIKIIVFDEKNSVSEELQVRKFF